MAQQKLEPCFGWCWAKAQPTGECLKMPIYEYQCSHCHHQFDLMQKITDKPVTQCPKCFEQTAVKLISAAGFQLKGTGWYATDFKTKPSGQSVSKESATTTDSDTGKTNSADSNSKSTSDTSKGGTGDKG